LSRARRVVHDAEPFDWTVVATAVDAPLEGERGSATAEPADDPHVRLAQIEHDAFARGLAQGEREGQETARAQIEQMTARLGRSLDELGALRTEIVRRTERQAVDLAMAIAKRMLARELHADPELLVALARVALDRLGEPVVATIRVSPEEFSTLAAGEARDHCIEIVSDAAVARGGCLVQSDFGVMDVSLDAQFCELARVLRAA
jgi:flagellar assembly protein FliH